MHVPWWGCWGSYIEVVNIVWIITRVLFGVDCLGLLKLLSCDYKTLSDWSISTLWPRSMICRSWRMLTVSRWSQPSTAECIIISLISYIFPGQICWTSWNKCKTPLMLQICAIFHLVGSVNGLHLAFDLTKSLGQPISWNIAWISQTWGVLLYYVSIPS